MYLFYEMFRPCPSTHEENYSTNQKSSPYQQQAFTSKKTANTTYCFTQTQFKDKQWGNSFPFY